mgnify:CR=1 FL=1
MTDRIDVNELARRHGVGQRSYIGRARVIAARFDEQEYGVVLLAHALADEGDPREFGARYQSASDALRSMVRQGLAERVSQGRYRNTTEGLLVAGREVKS